MFCPECGEKNKKGAKFCEFCGAKMEENTKKVEKSMDDSKKKVTPKEPMDKKKKIIIGVVVLVLAIVIIVLSCLSSNFKPNKIAKDYFLAIINNDTDELYKYSDVDNSGLTSKKIFKKVYDEDKIKVENYSVQSSEVSSDGLSATVTINYTLEGVSEANTTDIYLVKAKNKKFLIFDNWKVSGDSSVVKQNYEVKVPENSTLKIEGISASKKWLSKDSGDDYDLYVIPQIFIGEYDATITLKNGMPLETDLVVDGKATDLTNLEISDEMKKELEKVLPKQMTTLYQAAIDDKPFSEIKGNYNYEGADLEEIESAYNKLSKSISSSLKSVNITSTEIDDSKVNEDGYLELKVDAEYEYTKEYTFFGDTETEKDTDDAVITVTLDYADGDYKVIAMSTSYFSWF